MEPDGIVDGTDFVAFINSLAAGEVALNPIADVAGGIAAGPDGVIDGTDFIELSNAFGANCE